MLANKWVICVSRLVDNVLLTPVDAALLCALATAFFCHLAGLRRHAASLFILSSSGLACSAYQARLAHHQPILFLATMCKLQAYDSIMWFSPPTEAPVLPSRCIAAVLQIGKRHEFSAGLLIGGKAVAEEASRVNAMNILVATPGALLCVRAGEGGGRGNLH
jgi:ATP-dependent RNA helicase DDX10/DBP4